MTLKCHIILEHYNTYFTQTAKTLRHTNGEFVESCHYQLRKSEERHQFKMVKKLGSPKHQAVSIVLEIEHIVQCKSQFHLKFFSTLRIFEYLKGTTDFFGKTEQARSYFLVK